MPRRGTPGLVRGPVALHCCGRPHAGHPVHRYAVRGCAGLCGVGKGWREMPPTLASVASAAGNPERAANWYAIPPPPPWRPYLFICCRAWYEHFALASPFTSTVPLPPPRDVGALLSEISQPGDAGCSWGSTVRETLCVLGSLCVSDGDGVHFCLRSLQRHKGRLFFQADHLEIEAGTAKWRRGQARAGGGRRRGAELGLAGCLHPSPRVGLLRLLGLRRTWARAPCALSGEVRVATRVSSVSSDKRTVTSPG